MLMKIFACWCFILIIITFVTGFHIFPTTRRIQQRHHTEVMALVSLLLRKFVNLPYSELYKLNFAVIGCYVTIKFVEKRSFDSEVGI
jgi:hypothetical protein